MGNQTCLSAGNTGVCCYFKNDFKMMNEVNKPALAGLWPNQKGMNVVLDLGAILSGTIKI